jgi:hypothetical protein
MRLVNAALYKPGGRIERPPRGRFDCTEIVIQTMTAQDTEMVFAFPWSFASDLVEGRGAPCGAARAIPSRWPCAPRSPCLAPPRADAHPEEGRSGVTAGLKPRRSRPARPEPA